MINMPEVKIGIVAVSRDCFPESLSVNRRKALWKHIKTNMTEQTFMNVRSALLKVRSTWYRPWRM